MNVLDKILVLREGGNVRRCHTMPHLGEYTVGKHSYDAACLLIALHPEPSVDLLKAILLHDVPERWLGDLPAPAKWFEPSLATAYRRAEEAVSKQWDVELPGLSDGGKQWLHAVDRLEFFLWAHEQLNMGNKNVGSAIRAVLGWFDSHESEVPQPVLDVVRFYHWKRLPEFRREEDAGEQPEPQSEVG